MNGHQGYGEEMVEIDVHRGHHHTGSYDSHDGNSAAGVARPMQQPGLAASDNYISPGWTSSPLARRSAADSFASIPQMDSRSATPSLYQNNQSYQSQQSLTALVSAPPSPMLTKEWVEPGSVARVHDRDDVDIWKGWKRWVFRLAPFLTLANVIVYGIYLGLRIACVVLAQRAQGITFAAAWVFIAIELAVAIPSQMHNFWTMWAMKKRRRAKLRLTGEDVPTVDVFVTCCGEDDDLVLDTVRGACDQDYPRDRFRVIVLDDAKSQGLEVAIGHLSMIYPNVYYMARQKILGVPHHFKAGNLNYGIEQVRLLPGGAGQFMAALDADMIPEQEWLRAVLPHLLVDPKMALACPPQLFYNTPPSDPLSQSLDLFVHVIEPIKDSLGVAWCTGSGYIIRRDALDDIGNFPVGTLAEDVATSTLMLGKGWKTAYIHEPLQFGTVPEDFGSHIKQRTRWAVGTVETALKLNFCLWGKAVKQMSFPQRFSGFLYATLSFYNILVTASLFAIPIILIWGKTLVAYENEEQLRWLIRVCFASTILNRLCEMVLYIPAGYHTGQRGSRYQLWMSPYLALCIIRSFLLPKWLGGVTQAFKPTGSLASALNERDPKLRKNMIQRLWVILVNYMGIFHLAFVYFTLVGAVLASYRCFFETSGAKNVMLCLITHVFWPPLTFIYLCSSMWTPIAYAIDPPTMADREDLLNRDPKTGVGHPTQASKKIAFGGQAAWFELEYSTATVFTILVLIFSFFI